MDVPKGFKPEQNLDKDTDRLLKEEPKPKQKAELEDLLHDPYYYKSEFLHMTVEALAIKKGYKLLRDQSRIDWDYWTKPKNKEESYVLIRKNQRKIKHYSFATVEDNNLEEFCKRFIESEVYKKSFNIFRCLNYAGKRTDMGFCASTLLTSFFGGFSTAYLTIRTLGITRNYCWIGALLGFYLGSSLYSLCSHLSNKKKMKELCKELITDEKEAIKKALN